MLTSTATEPLQASCLASFGVNVQGKLDSWGCIETIDTDPPLMRHTSIYPPGASLMLRIRIDTGERTSRRQCLYKPLTCQRTSFLSNTGNFLLHLCWTSAVWSWSLVGRGPDDGFKESVWFIWSWCILMQLTFWDSAVVFMSSFNPTLHRGGGAFWPPLATLEPLSSNTKAWFGPISIWIWSHGYQLWPRPKQAHNA